MTLDTLRHNIGRLCLDHDNAMYIVVDVVAMPWSTPKYKMMNIKTGRELLLYPETMSNPNFVTWLTPPRQSADSQKVDSQNPVAQPRSVKILTMYSQTNVVCFVKALYDCHCFDACIRLYHAFTFLSSEKSVTFG